MSSQGTGDKSEKSVMQAPLLDKNEGIYFRCMDCKTRYGCVIQLLQDINPSDAISQGFDRESSLIFIQGIFTKFEAWACNVSTFQDVALRKKLEFSFNDGTELQRIVMRTLGNLRELLHDACLIISQKKVNESWQPLELGDSDEEGTTMESERTWELQELLKSMENANKLLFKVSNVVETISEKDDYLVALTIYQSEFDPNVDICLIREQCGSASDIDDWFITRLGIASTRRRQYLKYMETYPKEVMKSSDNIAVTEKKPYVPSHPLMALENIPIQFGVPFQCPFCRKEQVATNHAAWKEHIFSDLRPYICTFKECELKMFGSLDQWFSHELFEHRREWQCPMCLHTPFPSSPACEAHLRSEHQIDDRGSQIRGSLLMGEQQVDDVSATACPFCENWEKPMAEATEDSYMRLMAFKEHLGKHMEDLTFLSLPVNEGKM